MGQGIRVVAPLAEPVGALVPAFQDDGLAFQLAEEAGFQTQGFTWWNAVPPGPQGGLWTPVTPIGGGPWVPLDPSIMPYQRRRR